MKLAVHLAVAAFLLVGCGDGGTGTSDLDTEVREALAGARVTQLLRPPASDPALVTLGQALMFDKLLSGNRDVSCATCHNPRSATTDHLSLSIGTGGSGTGSARILGAASQFNPRNSQELFNRGHSEFVRMFWDGRVSQSNTGQLVTPAGAQLPAGLVNALAAQAMFPVTVRHEMRGQPGDLDRFGAPNELAELSDDDRPGIWAAIMARVLDVPEYVAMFQAAYPGVPPAELGFQHAANAIAAFETDAFTTVDSPLDRYLEGDAAALGEADKRGALLFFGQANCGSCHLGPHLTDHLFHSIGVPQVGPGMSPGEPEDRGRELVTASAAERFRFRTPPLRNVELTGPWMHDGAYTTLEGAVQHYLDAELSLENYDASQLREDLRGTHLSNPATLAAMAASIDSRYAPLTLSDAEVADIVSFLRSLTDPAANDLAATIPASVPSGLPVDE